jgi:capsular exopolysaccharide synthesis family protein
VDVRGHLGVLGRRWRLVAVIVLLCVLGSGALSKAASPTYQASASLFFSLQNGNSANELAQGSTFTQNQMASYATLATTATVLDPVIQELGLDTDVVHLARQVRATTPDATVVLKITVTSGSAAQAAAIANSVAENLTTAVDELAPVNAQGDPSVRSTVVAPAEEPQFQSAPNTRRNVIIGFLLGVVLGALAALVREALDTRVRDAEVVGTLTGLPVLGALTATGAERSGALVLADAPLDPQAERYRQLRTNLQFSQVPGTALVVGVTSSVAEEGKSTVALNLALALAEVSDRVLLVDADLRRPTIARRLGIEGGAGLSTVLIGRAGLDDVVQEWGPRGLTVLTAGAVPPNPTELLASPQMEALAAELAQRYDVVVFDTAPLLPVTDALLLSRHTTGMVVVANSRRVRRPQLVRALAALAQVDARVFGLVLTMLAPRGATADYGYHAEELGAAEQPWWQRLTRDWRRPARAGVPRADVPEPVSAPRGAVAPAGDPQTAGPDGPAGDRPEPQPEGDRAAVPVGAEAPAGAPDGGGSPSGATVRGRLRPIASAGPQVVRGRGSRGRSLYR